MVARDRRVSLYAARSRALDLLAHGSDGGPGPVRFDRDSRVASRPRGRRNQIPMRGITLFVFGGVAEMAAEPASARAELRMAAAGPAASIVIAVAGFGLSDAVRGFWPAPVVLVIEYLALLNGVLAGFNLLPAFPLDGGRIFRAALWTW